MTTEGPRRDQPGWQGQAPQQQYYPYPPQQGGPPPKKKMGKFAKFLLIIGGLFVLMIGCAALFASSEDEAGTGNPAGNGTSAEDGTQGEPADAGGAGIGTEVRDGRFSFVVNEVQSGLSEIGENEFLREYAQGQFVVVDLSVTNHGDRPQSFSSSNQKLFDTQGRQFSNSSMAEISLQDGSEWYTNINPGNTISTRVVFDIPADAEPASIKLHDSAFSRGADVSLR